MSGINHAGTATHFVLHVERKRRVVGVQYFTLSYSFASSVRAKDYKRLQHYAPTDHPLEVLEERIARDRLQEPAVASQSVLCKAVIVVCELRIRGDCR
jgi:hypothetical protein